MMSIHFARVRVDRRDSFSIVHACIVSQKHVNYVVVLAILACKRSQIELSRVFTTRLRHRRIRCNNTRAMVFCLMRDDYDIIIIIAIGRGFTWFHSIRFIGALRTLSDLVCDLELSDWTVNRN